MQEEIIEQLVAQDERLEKIFLSVEKTKKYFFWTLINSIITIIFFILPLLGLTFVIPQLLSMNSSSLGGF